MKQKVDNGNGKHEQQPELLMVRAGQAENNQTLKEIRSMIRGSNSADEKTKFSIAEGLQDFEKVPHFTEYRNFDEVQQMNQIEMYVTLAPLVFGNTDNVNKISWITAWSPR